MRQLKFRAWDGNSMLYEGWNGDFFATKEIIFRYDRVQQFTGRLDKNNKEIYEDDWCTAMFRTKEGIQVIQGRIIMDDYMWCIDCTGCVGDDIFSINRPHDFEVIGSIYETHHLLTSPRGQMDKE